MRECPYQLYLAIYDAVRAGVAQRDRDIVRRISSHIAGRDAETTLVMMLALLEARRGDRPRRRDEVCDSVMCRLCTQPALHP